jgi:aryl-alcohol dehydrogenase-like predicted oxidoreductase
MYFGTKVSEEAAFNVLDTFHNSGGNFIDTANNYSYWVGGNGEESELLLGKWMQQNGSRKHIILATKVGAMPKDRNNPASKLEGLRSNTIIQGCEDSLRRLKTDYLDLFYIHADLKEYPLEERWEALFQLEKSGKIRSKGCSNYDFNRLVESENIGRKIGNSGSTAFQQKMSFLHPKNVSNESNLRFVDADILKYVEENQRSLLTYSVLLSGGYEREFEELPEEYQSDDNQKKFEFVLQQSKEANLTPSQWVLQWISQQSEQIIPLIAASSVQQLNMNLAVFK